MQHDSDDAKLIELQLRDAKLIVREAKLIARRLKGLAQGFEAH